MALDKISKPFQDSDKDWFENDNVLSQKYRQKIKFPQDKIITKKNKHNRIKSNSHHQCKVINEDFNENPINQTFEFSNQKFKKEFDIQLDLPPMMFSRGEVMNNQIISKKYSKSPKHFQSISFKGKQLEIEIQPKLQEYEDEDLKFIGQVDGCYNPNQIPPDINVAKIHQKARFVSKKKDNQKEIEEWQHSHEHNHGIADINQDFSTVPTPRSNIDVFKYDKCPCCNYHVEREQLNLNADTKELEFLGSGFPMFFNFIQWCFQIMAIYFIICGSFDLYSNLQGDFCNERTRGQSHGCIDSYSNRLSLVNKRNLPHYIHIQNYLNAIITIIQMVLLMIFRRDQRYLDDEIDGDICSPQDYSIMVRNIPTDLNIDYEQELKRLFANHSVLNRKINPKEISLVYNIEYLQEMQTELDIIIEKKQDYVTRFGIKSAKAPFSAEYQDIVQEMSSILNRMKNFADYIRTHPAYFAGYAFISFNTQEERNLVLQYNSHNRLDKFYNLFHKNQWQHENPDHDDLLFNGYKILINQAFEPQDVNWDAFFYTGFDRLKGRIISFFFTFLLAIASTLILLLLTVFQDFYIKSATSGEKISQDQEDNIIYLSFVISVTIFILNHVATDIIPRLVEIEKHVSKSNQIISFSIKLFVLQFLNSAVIDFLITSIFSKNYYGRGGFIQTQTIIFFQNMFMTPLLNILNMDYWIWKYEKIQLEKGLKNNKVFMTQRQLNVAFEYPEYSISDKYSDIINTMWVTFLYAPLIPIVLPFSLVYIILTYYIEKYTIMRRSTVKDVLSRNISVEMTEYLEFIIIFYSIGNFLFEWQILGTCDIFSLFQLLFGITYSMLPMQAISEKIWKSKLVLETKTWEDAVAEGVFEVTYEDCNSITGLISDIDNQLKAMEEPDRLQLILNQQN